MVNYLLIWALPLTDISNGAFDDVLEAVFEISIC